MVEDSSQVGDQAAPAEPQRINSGPRRPAKKDGPNLGEALEEPAANSGDLVHAPWCGQCAHPPHTQLIRVTVRNLPANYLFSLRLRPWFGRSFWALGSDDSGVGFAIRGETDQSTIRVGQLRVTRSEILFAPIASTPSVTLEAYVVCHASMVGGEISIPAAANASLQSSFDAQNLIGTTSWYLRLF